MFHPEMHIKRRTKPGSNAVSAQKLQRRKSTQARMLTTCTSEENMEKVGLDLAGKHSNGNLTYPAYQA